MLYFRHADLVKKYRISLKTVHNWIDAAKQGKLDLKLHETYRGTYIANTPGNTAALGRLVEQRKKYRNTRFHKVVTPKLEFYQLYSRRQILDIISNLNIHREIPRQYNYMDGGADKWDEYAQQMWDDTEANQLKSTVELLSANLDSIDSLIRGYKRVNVIDIGVGNATPVKGFIKHLLSKGVLHRYVAVDISEAMLHIAKRNIEQWFGDEVKFEGYVRDVSFERFDDLLLGDMLSGDSDQTINLVLLLGGTLHNLRTPGDMLRAIYGSMGYNDLLLYTDKPDSETSRNFFRLDSKADGANALSPTHGFVLDPLNISETLYDVEAGFSEHVRMRYKTLRLKTALTLDFKSAGVDKSVKLEKDETILLWRAWHLSAPQIMAEFEKVGFVNLQSSITKDREYLLTISGVDTKLGLEF